MKISNTHLLDELVNATGNVLKAKRIADIQNVIEDRYSHANGDESSDIKESEVESTEVAKIETDEQAKDVAAKEHARKEPARIFGVNVWVIVGGVAVLGGSIWAYNKYFKNQ